MRTGYSRAVWIAFFACGLLGMGLFTLRLGPEAESALYVTYSCAAAAAIFSGVYLHRPRPLTSWLLIGAGQACNTLGDFAYTRSMYLRDPAMPAGLFEWFYLVGQVCFLIGLAQIFIRYRRLINRNAVTQGAMVAIGLATLIWVQVVSPNLARGLGWIEWSRIIVYPVCLMIIFSVASIFLMTGMGTRWSYRLLFTGVMFYAIGLSFYIQIASNTVPVFRGSDSYMPYVVDAAYSLAYLLVGAAYLHPSMRDFHDGFAEKGDTVTRMELALLAGAFWIGPLAYALSTPGGLNLDMLVLLASMLLIFALNEWRLARLVVTLEAQNKELHQHREMLHYQAYHDALTGLPNRAFLYNHLEGLIEQTRLRGVPGAVFLIDVNNFKQVNDTLGHDEGDRVLKEVASAFSTLKRKEDVVGRWGGDEFMIVLENLPDEASARSLARRLHQEMRWTVSGSEGAVDMSISIGICLIPTGNEKLQAIVKKADLALYQAKRTPEIGIAFSGW